MRWRAAILDVDGTVVEPVSSWRYIHERLGKWDALACRYQEMFLAGRIDYRTFCELDAAHWKGLRDADLAAMFREVPWVPNVEPCLRELREAGCLLFAVSTGLQYIPERLVAEMGFACAVSNRLVSRDGVLTGDVEIVIPHGGKGECARSLLGRHGIPLGDAVAVGDSAGDVAVAEIAGYSIAFNSSCPELSAVCDYECRTRDFREVRDAILRAGS